MLEIDYFLQLLHIMKADGMLAKFLQCYYEGCSNSMDVCPYEGWKQVRKVCIRLAYNVSPYLAVWTSRDHQPGNLNLLKKILGVKGSLCLLTSCSG
ncbi:hypothetical protein Bca4012_025703 [Brassica carinata]